MDACLASQLGVPLFREVRLGDATCREAHDAPPAGVPVAHAAHPQEVGPQCIRIARELAVARPVLGVAMVRHVLHLVEGTRIKEHESKYPTDPLVEPASAKHSAMTELVLSRIEEIEERAVNHEGRNCPPGAPREPQESAGCAHGTHMRCR